LSAPDRSAEGRLGITAYSFEVADDLEHFRRGDAANWFSGVFWLDWDVLGRLEVSGWRSRQELQVLEFNAEFSGIFEGGEKEYPDIYPTLHRRLHQPS